MYKSNNECVKNLQQSFYYLHWVTQQIVCSSAHKYCVKQCLACDSPECYEYILDVPFFKWVKPSILLSICTLLFLPYILVVQLSEQLLESGEMISSNTCCVVLNL
jgi:hypothetical protein